MGFSRKKKNHPFGGIPIYGNPHIYHCVIYSNIPWCTYLLMMSSGIFLANLVGIRIQFSESLWTSMMGFQWGYPKNEWFMRESHHSGDIYLMVRFGELFLQLMLERNPQPVEAFPINTMVFRSRYRQYWYTQCHCNSCRPWCWCFLWELQLLACLSLSLDYIYNGFK